MGTTNFNPDRNIRRWLRAMFFLSRLNFFGNSYRFTAKLSRSTESSPLPVHMGSLPTGTVLYHRGASVTTDGPPVDTLHPILPIQIHSWCGRSSQSDKCVMTCVHRYSIMRNSCALSVHLPLPRPRQPLTFLPSPQFAVPRM